MRALRAAALLALLAAAPRARAQPVGGEFRVSTTTTESHYRASVAHDGAGAFVVVWERRPTFSSTEADVFGQRFGPNGAPRGGEFRINTYTTGVQGRPRASADFFGNFVVVWDSFGQDGEFGGVYGQRYAAGGAPLGAEFRVNAATTGVEQLSGVAASPGGGFVVVYTGRDGSNNAVVGRRFDGAGAPLTGDFAINTYTTNIQSGPQVGADAAGNFVVAWISLLQDGSASGVYAQRFAASGAPLGTEFRVNTLTTERQTSPTLAVAPTGEFVVAWHDLGHTTDYKIFAQRYDRTGAPAGGEFEVNTFTTSDQKFPAAAATRDGSFVIAWISPQISNAGFDVFAQRISASGARLGGEFRVNSETFDDPLDVAVASTPGGFTVVWAQDFPTSGVFGQRFRAGAVAGDVDGNGGIDVLDAFYLINFLFANGPPPPK